MAAAKRAGGGEYADFERRYGLQVRVVALCQASPHRSGRTKGGVLKADAVDHPSFAPEPRMTDRLD
jgi:hypothetical protein